MLSTLLNSYDFQKAMAKQRLGQQLLQLGESRTPIQETRTILEILQAYPELAAKKFGMRPYWPFDTVDERNPPSWKLPQALPLLHLVNSGYVAALPVDILKEVYEMHPPAIFSNYTDNEYFCSPLFFAVRASTPEIISFLVSKNPKAVSEPNSRGLLPIHCVYVHYRENFSVLKMLLDVAPVGIFEPYRRSLFSLALRRGGMKKVLDLFAEKTPRGVLHNAVISQVSMSGNKRKLLVNFFDKLDSDQKINLHFWQCRLTPGLISTVAAMTDSVVSLSLDNCYMGLGMPADDAGPDWSSCPVEKVTLSSRGSPSTLQWLLRGFGTMPNLSELHLHTEHTDPQAYSKVLETFVHPPLQLLEIRGFVMKRKHLAEMLTESTGECTIIFQGPNEPEPVVAISYYSAMNCHARGIANWTTKSLIDGLLAAQADQRVLGPFKFPLLYGLMRETPSLWTLE